MTDPRPRPLPVTPAHRPARGRRPAGLALLVLAALVAVGAVAAVRPTTASASPLAPAQEFETTTTAAAPSSSAPPETEPDAAEPDAEEPDAAEPAAEEEPEAGAGSQRVADENRKIWFVVAALVAVAVALSLLTLRYWHQTRPVTPASADLDDDEVVVVAAAPRARADAPGRRSRRAVAGADHAEADESWEPRGTGEHARVEVPASTRSPRPSREQRAAAYQATGRT